MNPLQHIEQTYNFQYPKLYHQLYENGMLNMGAKYPYHSYCPIEYKNGDRLPNKEWLEQEYPKLKENPPLFSVCRLVSGTHPLTTRKRV